MIDLRLDRKVRQRVDASDIVQEVLVDAHRRLDEYLQNPSMPFLLWLRSITKDRIIDAHRRHRVSAKRSVDREQPLAALGGSEQSTIDLAAEIADEELTPAAAAAMGELQIRFETAIHQLGEQDQEIVLMRHFEGLSNQEIAEILQLTEPAASMRYLRAIRRLRSLLSETLHGMSTTRVGCESVSNPWACRCGPTHSILGTANLGMVLLGTVPDWFFVADSVRAWADQRPYCLLAERPC
jgi:RNA polymerase sigma-70 factor (ECF subfamily)